MPPPPSCSCLAITQDWATRAPTVQTSKRMDVIQLRRIGNRTHVQASRLRSQGPLGCSASTYKWACVVDTFELALLDCNYRFTCLPTGGGAGVWIHLYGPGAEPWAWPRAESICTQTRHVGGCFSHPLPSPLSPVWPPCKISRLDGPIPKLVRCEDAQRGPVI